MSDKTYAVDRSFPVDKPPKRVVSLVPSMTETLFDLGVGDRVVGITDYCVYPQDKVMDIAKVGGTKNPSIDQIIALKPDLVIVNQEENSKADVEQLHAVDIPVWITFPKTVQDVMNLFWDVMDLFNEQSMAPRVRLIESTFDWLDGISLADEENLPTVFVPIWNDPLMTFNKDTYMHDLLRVCGAHNVFAERDRKFPLEVDLGIVEPLPAEDNRFADKDTRYPHITFDEIVTTKPDIVLLPDEPYPFAEKDLRTFMALDVPATRNKQVHLVDGSHLTWHGTRIAYAFDTLPTLLNIKTTGDAT